MHEKKKIHSLRRIIRWNYINSYSHLACSNRLIFRNSFEMNLLKIAILLRFYCSLFRCWAYLTVNKTVQAYRRSRVMLLLYYDWRLRFGCFAVDGLFKFLVCRQESKSIFYLIERVVCTFVPHAHPCVQFGLGSVYIYHWWPPCVCALTSR